MTWTEEQAILKRLARQLVDPRDARVLIPADRPCAGSWFGGGNLWEAADGTLYLVGRYRNPGDSRTGLAAGERGFALACFRSTDRGQTFERLWMRDKASLAPEGESVLSIEGAALASYDDGVVLLVSSEKANRRYPDPVAAFQKPGTGIWTVDVLAAPTPEALESALPRPWLASTEPDFLHVKDPFVVSRGGKPAWIGVCTHPFSWSSSNTAIFPAGAWDVGPKWPTATWIERGRSWDVAITRVTAMVDLSRWDDGRFGNDYLAFFDGGECLREHPPHPEGVRRARGYSCEELSGAAHWRVGEPRLERLDPLGPMFTSPHGSGCCRYVDVWPSEDYWFATWQQAAADGSQPLMIRRVRSDDLAWP